jgi:hypothetical protein
VTWLEEGGGPGLVWGGGDKANLGSRRHIPGHFWSKFSAYGCRLTILRTASLSECISGFPNSKGLGHEVD